MRNLTEYIIQCFSKLLDITVWRAIYNSNDVCDIFEINYLYYWDTPMQIMIKQIVSPGYFEALFTNPAIDKSWTIKISVYQFLFALKF